MDSLFSSASSLFKASQASHSSKKEEEEEGGGGGGGEKGSNQSPSDGHGHGEGEGEGHGHGHSSAPSYGEAFASAQVLMGAAKAKLGGGGSGGSAPQTDMSELAGAAANLIDAASHYGNLEKTSYGSYLEKAETYLHDYGAKNHNQAGSGSHGGNPNKSEHQEPSPPGQDDGDDHGREDRRNYD